MLTVVAAATGLVVTMKVAVVAPAAMEIVEGTVAAALSLSKLTTAPPAGAGPESVRVPAAEEPPVSATGASDKDVRLT